MLFLILLPSLTNAQSNSNNLSVFDIDIDPIAYTMNGFSIHGGYIMGALRFDLGVYGLDLPEWIHNNDDFKASFVGAGWKIDRFFKGYADGFFAGLEGGVAKMNVTHKSSNIEKDQIGYSVGVRTGYRWNTGLGNIFITPWFGLGYNLNPKDVTIEGDTFESARLQPFPTVHIGWKF